MENNGGFKASQLEIKVEDGLTSNTFRYNTNGVLTGEGQRGVETSPLHEQGNTHPHPLF